ncbi:MAG TPA: prolyl oligopeptidase family serine peptidase [Candidatus Limnocylindria bacterium]
MDIHQLRSWIFELYEPLEDERQYIVFDRARGNLLIDAPPFSERALRLIRGAGPASVLLITNGARGGDAARYRDALGVQIAAHAADASFVPGGADLVLKSEDLVRPDARVIRVGENGDGATVVLGRMAGGVLFCGDLDLASDAAAALTALQFSSVLSARRPPIWNAGRDTLQFLQRELPQPRKRFGILLQAPWDRAYKGRLEDQMKPNPLIVPAEETAAREAAMGPGTLVAANQVRERTEAAPRPTRAAATAAAGPAQMPAPAAPGSSRPRSFAEDWNATGTISPPTTVANAPADLRLAPAHLRPTPLGAGFTRLDVDLVAGLPTVDVRWGGIDLSPDGREVAFAWNQSGSDELYSAPIDDERIIQLTESGSRSVSPRWSPDGSEIAFLRDEHGTEHFAVWIVDRDGTRERKLTSEDALTFHDIEWSPDGRSITCVGNAGGRGFSIQRIDVASGARNQLTDGTFQDARPTQSPDGAWILFESWRVGSRAEADLFVMPSSGGAAVRLDTRAGAAGDAILGRWSPDGRTIAFTTNARGRREIALMTWDGSAATSLRYLTENPFDELAPSWRPDGRGVIYLQDKDAARTVWRVFGASRATTPAMDLAGMYASPRVGPDSETIVAAFSSPTRPTDVWVREGDQLTLRPLTNSIGSAIDPKVLVEPTHLRYPGAGGQEIPALLYLPHAEALRSGGRPGAVLYVHGGPTAQHYRSWDPIPQLLANRGLVVLAPNIRGSTGYGREFQEANRRDWGGADLADVIAGADWLAAEGIADGALMGIAGGGYGGYLTLLALGMHPDRFAAGVSIAGMVSLPTLFDTTRGDLREALIREFGDPTKDAQLYRDRSPIAHAAAIRAAVLVLQGANDPRVPRNEGLQLVEALTSNGAPHEFHEYPDEGHGFSKTESRIDALRRTVDWLSKYLTPMMDRYLAD